MTKWGNVQPSLDNSEHIGPDTTGDNIHAKKVVSYTWNSTSGEWERAVKNLTSGVDFDYIDAQQTDEDTDTYVFKTGGSGGTTVRTITINYTDANKTTVDNVSWS